MKPPRIETYLAFWGYYLREHAQPATRRWHYLGTTLTLVCLALAIITWNGWWLVGMVVLGYAPAWVGHFTVERNRPATFRYPLWSLISDLKLYVFWLSGRLPDELKKAGVVG